MRKIWLAIKPYLRWFILGGTLFFLLQTLKDRWQEVAKVRIDGNGWGILVLALVVTLVAHIWSGWVWTWILRAFKQPVSQRWALEVYLKTNIAKYLPGNIWHYAGRISAITKAGGSLGEASFSVLIEPLLMAAAALFIALLSSSLGFISTTSNPTILGLQVIGLVVVLLGIHPLFLNPVIKFLNRSKKVTETGEVKLEGYPLSPLLGEMGFLFWRGSGFLLTLLVFFPVTPSQIPQLLSSFSFAWLLGLVVPGAPGGLGIFEATIIALLRNQISAGLILTVVAIFRMVSVLAELLGAGLGIVSECVFTKGSRVG